MLKTRVILDQEELETIITRCNGNLALLDEMQERPIETIDELKDKLLKKNYVGLELISLEDENGECKFGYLHDVIGDMNPKPYEIIYLNEILSFIAHEADEYSYDEEFINGVKNDLIKSHFGSLEYIY